MSKRKSTVALIIGALLLAGGAFFWIHGHGVRSEGALVSSPEVASPENSPVANSIDKRNDSSEHSSPSNLKQPSSASETPVRVGEVLDFAADVSKLNNVANLRLQIAERRDFLGKSAWHLQAFAHTENPLRMVFELDDQFDSYSDASTLTSLQYEMHLSERGQKIDSIQRMTVTGKEPAPANATETRVLPGTRDPLGLMQYLREVDWAKTPEVRSPVYDGHKLYDVRASFSTGSEAVVVPAGKYTASKIGIRVFDGGTEMKDANFTLYLANNAEHTPVLLEAVMPFATARVQLAKAK
jgi:Protein of unknown function (DUF3108)